MCVNTPPTRGVVTSWKPLGEKVEKKKNIYNRGLSTPGENDLFPPTAGPRALFGVRKCLPFDSRRNNTTDTETKTDTNDLWFIAVGFHVTSEARVTSPPVACLGRNPSVWRVRKPHGKWSWERGPDFSTKMSESYFRLRREAEDVLILRSRAFPMHTHLLHDRFRTTVRRMITNCIKLK